MQKSRQSKDHDDIFDKLKEAVVNEAMDRHQWEDKAAEMLRVIQINTLEDRNVTDKSHWDSALRFLEDSLQSKISTNDSNLHEQVSLAENHDTSFYLDSGVNNKCKICHRSDPGSTSVGFSGSR